MTTTTEAFTLQRALNRANPQDLASLLQKIMFGNMLQPAKVVAAGLTAAASFDITTAAFKALCTITGITLRDEENLPPIGSLVSLRVVASGTAGSLGCYIFGDSGATPIVPPGGAGAAVGIARISDDGKTVNFPNTVTAFTMIYVPRAAIDLSGNWPIAP